MGWVRPGFGATAHRSNPATGGLTAVLQPGKLAESVETIEFIESNVHWIPRQFRMPSRQHFGEATSNSCIAT